MHEKTRYLVMLTLFGVGLVLGLVLAGIFGAGDIPDAEEHERRSADAESTVGSMVGELEELEGQVRSAGEGIERGRSVVGEIRRESAIIEEGSGEAYGAAGRLEAGISKIEEILHEAEAQGCYMEGCGGGCCCGCSGGDDCRDPAKPDPW